MIKVGLIRVLTTTDKEVLGLHGKILENTFTMQVESKCIKNQPQGVFDVKSHQEAAPKVVELAENMEREGFDGIIISCAGDPGVSECQKRLSIPVVGAGRALASIAIAVSDRVGVLTLRDGVPDCMTEILADRLLSKQSIGVKNTLELMEPSGMEKVISSSQSLHSTGVDVITLACTGTATIGAKPQIEKNVPEVKVVDPVIASGSVMMSYLTNTEVE